MPLNLERSLKMGEEIGGHLVSGHVHCMGKVKEFKKGKEKILTIFRDGVCFNITTQSSLGISCEEIDEIHIKDFSNTDIKNHFEKDKIYKRFEVYKNFRKNV